VTCNQNESAHPLPQPIRKEEPAGVTNNDALAAEVGAIAAMLRELLTAATQDPDRLLTVEEVAALFQLSPRTLKDRAAAGAIAHHRFGKHYRFSRDDITNILSSYAHDSRPPMSDQRIANARRTT
jgi:excisionase family DNA binding protein